jgi:hypothetical protein
MLLVPAFLSVPVMLLVQATFLVPVYALSSSYVLSSSYAHTADYLKSLGSVVISGKIGTSVITSNDVDMNDNTISFDNSLPQGLSSGDVIWLANGSAVNGVSPNVPYFVEVVNADTIKIHNSKAGAIGSSNNTVVDLTGQDVISIARWNTNPILNSHNISAVIRNYDTINNNLTAGNYTFRMLNSAPDADYNIQATSMTTNVTPTQFPIVFVQTQDQFTIRSINRISGNAQDPDKLYVMLYHI